MVDRSMRRLPTQGMTVFTVAASGKVLTICAVSRDKSAAARVMAVGAVGKMRRGINKCICMTGSTVGGA